MNTPLTINSLASTPVLVSQFFEKALVYQQLVNTYVFLGHQPESMMAFITKLAQVLNCKQPPSQNTACGNCHNCKWHQQNAHPAFMTITNWDVEEKKLKKSIPVEDLKGLLSELARHSGGLKRFVILVGATSNTAQSSADEAYEWPNLMKEAAKDKMVFCGLNRQIFTDLVANKLLKSLEEPPLDTHFFILAEHENHLLETILSRAQVIRWQSSKHENEKPASETMPEAIEAFLEQLWQTPQFSQPLMLSGYIEKLSQEHDISCESLLLLALNYGQQLFQAELEAGEVTTEAFQLFQAKAQGLHLALQQLKAPAKPEPVIDNFALSL